MCDIINESPSNKIFNMMLAGEITLREAINMLAITREQIQLELERIRREKDDNGHSSTRNRQ